jgi:hypothetical protein
MCIRLRYLYYLTSELATVAPERRCVKGFYVKPLKNNHLKQGNFDYLTNHKGKVFTAARQRITYSYNNVENTIIGYVEENGDLICLYEYRGQYFGTEFLISFSRNSASYKLLNAEQEEELSH